MKHTDLKAYEAPLLDVVTISSSDILTLSAGFDGEDHELPMP